MLVISNIYCWTDSTVALAWIRSSPHRWRTFIANRVAQIQDLVPPDSWRHVSTHDNPADLPSRGVFPDQLEQCSLWWAGPSYLSHSQNEWPINSFSRDPPSEFLQEESKIALFVEQTPSWTAPLFERFSSLRKIQGVLAYCLRWRHKTTGPLSEHELHHALLILALGIQREQFATERAMILAGETCPKVFRKLSPFIDDNDILRVGGRLKLSDLPYDAKHPILLPRQHKISELLVYYIHQKYAHAGVQTTLYLLEQNFFVIGARRLIRQIVSRCYRCFRAKPRPLVPKMGDLPRPRISEVKPFSCSGVDFAGPFNVLMSRHRGNRSTKAYLCLFICFATKAIHVELASDLSAATFIAALRRFIARRGRCDHLFSDCGTNFVGANRQLLEMMQDAAGASSIQWSFNPPSTTHFGGLWESGVKSVKTHMRRVVGTQILTYEELNTLIVQIEAVLNSRPLCSISTDPNDLQALTPGHFLTIEPLTAPPNPSVINLNINRLTRWQLLQRMQQHFWVRWHAEYPDTLYERGKWYQSNRTQLLDEGTLVLIKEDNLPPLEWHLGRVTQTIQGPDGLCRVAKIRTTGGLLTRPLVKLCPLPNQ